MKRTLKVLIGAMVIEFVVAFILGINLPSITGLVIITHGLVAIWATYVFTGTLFNGGKHGKV